jgi:hypothetical protein
MRAVSRIAAAAGVAAVVTVCGGAVASAYLSCYQS